MFSLPADVYVYLCIALLSSLPTFCVSSKWIEPRVYFRFLGRNKSSEYCIWFEDYDDKKIIETPLSTGKYMCTSMRSNVIRYYPSLIRQVFKNRRNLVREMKYISSPPKLTSGIAYRSFLGRRSIGEVPEVLVPQKIVCRFPFCPISKLFLYV